MFDLHAFDNKVYIFTMFLSKGGDTASQLDITASMQSTCISKSQTLAYWVMLSQIAFSYIIRAHEWR